jgi:hypothetical protein
MNAEADRIAIAAALIRSGVCDDDLDLLQWHPCATCPSKDGRCACAGAPYVSDGVWTELAPVIAAIRAAGRTAAAADLRQRVERVWPDPMGQWSAEQADAGRAMKEAVLRVLAKGTETDG